MLFRSDGVLAGLLFGSVAHEVMRKTRIPLLLVPVSGRDEAEGKA